jgi:hypothetical protein
MMKLFNVKLTTLKSKLYAIVFASFVVRVVAFFTLPNTSSNLGPDEGNYGALTESVSQGKPADKYTFTTLYIISRSLIVPSTLINRFGFNGLDSVRITASVYGLMTLLLAVFLFLKLQESDREVSKFVSTNQKKTLFLAAIFAFLPSCLGWSILGLREAVLAFWVTVVFALVFYVYQVKKSPSKIAALGILLAIILVFSSRPQVGWVVGVTLLTYFLLKVRVRASQILIPVTLIGILLGYIVTTPFSIESTETFTLYSPTTTTKTQFDSKNFCKFDEEEIIFQGVKFKCLRGVDKKSIQRLKNPGIALIDQVEAIPERQEGNRWRAASVIKNQTCPIIGESRAQKYLCIAYRAPYTSFTFLFRPMLGADVTSSSSLFAAIENFFWLTALLFVIVMYIRNRRLAFFGALAPSLLFFSLYTIGAGAYEGNMGTAFRHKSLILWVVILLVASSIAATQQRKAEQQGKSSSSQE